MAVWAAVFVGRRRGELILGALSLLALLVGGGFVPVWIGLVAAVTANYMIAPVSLGRVVGYWDISSVWPCWLRVAPSSWRLISSCLCWLRFPTWRAQKDKRKRNGTFIATIWLFSKRPALQPGGSRPEAPVHLPGVDVREQTAVGYGFRLQISGE
jgi:hypothetical protein